MQRVVGQLLSQDGLSSAATLPTAPVVATTAWLGQTVGVPGAPQTDHRYGDEKEPVVLDVAEQPISGLYAAGELVGGLYYFNYAGGTGLTAGAVFGRIAGAGAAQHVQTG